jgi:type I restriction enzyme S subunit
MSTTVAATQDRPQVRENAAVPGGYKRTDVGVLPNAWNCTTVSGIASRIRNATVGGPFGSDLVSRDYVEYGVPIIRGQNLGGMWVTGPFAYVSSAKADSLQANLARPGDLVFTQRGTLGQVSLIPEGPYGRYLISQSQMKLTLDASVADPLFFFFVFSSPEQQSYIRQNTIQTGVPHINLGILRDIPVQLPALPEQRAIAGTLLDVDRLISALDKHIAKKRAIMLGMMQQLLTGKTRLQGAEGKWEVQELRHVIRDFIVPMRDKPKKFTGDTPWCRIEDFEGKYLSESKSGQCVDTTTISEMNLRVHPVGTLLVSCSADLGHCAIVRKPLVTNQTFIGMVVNENVASNEFLYYYMTFNAESLNELSSGTTISYLSRQQFESFKILVPITKEEQASIASVLSEMDAEITALEHRRDKTKFIKQGMMQALLAGRIRLVKAEEGA